MKTLSKQLSKLLFVHDCVIVPGFGGFITNYRPATIHTQHHTFYPPSLQITFNAALLHNDGILINAYASALSVDFATAKSIVDEKVHAMRIALMKGNKVELDEIGYFITNRDNNIEFYPANKVNYLGEAYGFTRFDFSPVIREAPYTIPGIDRQAVRSTMRWAAVLLPLAAVAMFTTLHTGTLNSLYDNYASLLPSANQPMAVSREAGARPVKTNTANYSNKNNISSGVTAAAKPAVTTPAEEIAGTTIVNPSGDDHMTVNSSREAVINSDNAVLWVNSTFHIIAGAFGIPENAQHYAGDLKAQGFNASVIGPNRRNLHLVSIAGFNDKTAATQKMNELKSQGFPGVWLLEER